MSEPLESPPSAPPPLPEGRLSGRTVFVGLLRQAFAAAAEEGWTRIVLCDPDFADWPLGEREVVAALRKAGIPGASGVLHGRTVPLIGRVTMDLTHFDVTDLPAGSVRAGDFIEVFGKNMPIQDVALAGGTIDYELLTSLGRRYERRYELAKK